MFTKAVGGKSGPQSGTQIRTPEALIPKELGEGGRVRAKVLYISDAAVNLRLPNGEIIRAVREGRMPVRAGDLVDIAMLGSDESGLLLEIVGISHAPESNADTPSDILIRLGISPEPENIKLLDALEEMNIPPEQKLIQRASVILKAFPELDVKSALFAAANGIEPTDRTVSAIRDLFSGENKIAGQIRTLMDILSGSVSRPGTVSVPEAAGTGAEQGRAEAGLRAALTAARTQTEIDPESADRTAAVEAAADAPVNMSGDTPGADAMLRRAAVTSLAREMLDAGAPNLNALDPEKLLAEGVEFVLRETVRTTENPEADIAGFIRDQYDFLPESEARKLTEVIRRAYAVASDAITAAALPETLEEQEMEQARTVLEKLYAELTGRAAQNGARLRQTAEQLAARLRVVRAYVENTAGENTAAARQVERLITTAELISELDRFCYFQIPIRMMHGGETAELYVFRNGRRRAVDPEDASILLAIDTENIRRIESLITVKGKNIHIEFGVASDEVSSFLRKNSDVLHRLLRDAGYKLGRTEYVSAGKPVNPPDALAVRQPRNIAGGSVDIQL